MNSDFSAIWIGGIFSEEALLKHRAVNQAQNKWSVGLVRALKNLNWNIHCLAHRPEQAWPKGDIYPGSPNDFHDIVNPIYVPTFNLPKLREYWLCHFYKRSLFKHLEANPHTQTLISYNPLPWHRYAASKAKRAFGIPWISITLDFKYPGPQMQNFVEANRDANGQVILSWWGYQNCPLAPKIHLDAGIDTIHEDKSSRSPESKSIILYAGKYNDYGGSAFLLEIIQECKNRDVEFWLLGKGITNDIKRAAERDDRIKPFGFVTEPELIEKCQKAHVFLNPRPNSFADNLMTFPSKILFYLSFGKPIISTWTPGLSEEYGDHLIIPNEETSKRFAQKIDDTIELSDERLSAMRNAQFAFLREKKSWNHQANKLASLAYKLTDE